jgi:hypothetical protein
MDFRTMITQKHEELLKSILKQCLKREVVTEDAKRLTMVFQTDRSNHLDYDLAFDGVIIGHVNFVFPSSIDYRYEMFMRFTPRAIASVSSSDIFAEVPKT